MNFQELKATLPARIEAIKSQIAMLETGGAIERCNTVVMYSNGLTVCLGEDKKPFNSSQDFPNQYTPETAAMLCATVRNGGGEAPQAVTPLTFYRRQLTSLETGLEVLENIPSGLPVY